MNALFRADASAAIGTGHVMRCLALADELSGGGVDCRFACREIPPLLAKRIADAGHSVEILPARAHDTGAKQGPVAHAGWLGASWRDDADDTAKIIRERNIDWAVADHYALDAQWEEAIAAHGVRIAAIDDLADRRHSCDILVDHNLHDDLRNRYHDLVPAGCHRLLGPKYALLRPEFRRAHDTARRFGGKATRFLVAFGGIDAANLTLLALEAVERVVPPGGHVDIVIGNGHARRRELEGRCHEGGWNLHVQTERLAELMAQADIAIGAGGGTLWERAATGLPSIAIAVAENQREQVAAAARHGLLRMVDPAGLTASGLGRCVADLAEDRITRERMSKACLAAVDGLGAGRVASRINPPAITLRLAAAGDSADLYRWRNDQTIRRQARNSKPIARQEHERWFAATLADPARRLLIAQDAGGPLGVVRFDKSGNRAEISIYLVPDHLGKGLGPALLAAAEGWFAGDSPEIDSILAEVLPGNRASQQLFESSGYSQEGRHYVKKTGIRT